METTILSLPLIPVATAVVVGILVAVLLLWRRGGQAKVAAAAPSASHARSNGALAAQEADADTREKCIVLFGECQSCRELRSVASQGCRGEQMPRCPSRQLLNPGVHQQH